MIASISLLSDAPHGFTEKCLTGSIDNVYSYKTDQIMWFKITDLLHQVAFE